ncbi:hypothetical protein [Vibrio parahaemolyticus]|uniref:hypothetical protein n=1 Tax=Vibrio parahaemolyticus TaxID=670 RepID=UPI0011C708E2|nr:hypothetical protein [Vibrio parahaemolyticus]EHR6472061.1 hypothetical protein [Vibrio parahaemolyticus]MBE3683289.1 hypothetical protein [Vibrio parahaemolyticus]TXM15448.1 hypothetical protein FVP09_03870 [Vibrio parahaemolyticus]
MVRPRRISAVMHKLLIEKGMDGFSVVELRDAAISIEGLDSNLHEMRKKVYRQILRFEKKSWLESEGSGRKKRYYQTALFKDLHSMHKGEITGLRQSTIDDYPSLKRERSEYKGELSIVIGKIDMCQSLMTRFPELESTLTPLLHEASENSASLLGKINLLNQVITILSEGQETC